MLEAKAAAGDTLPQALFGGAFDPLHSGHVALVQAAFAELPIDTLHIIPTGIAPHKPSAIASNTQRVAWLQAVFGSIANVHIDERELHRATPSITIQTLRELRAEYPHTPLIWVMGADSFTSLDTWHEWRELFTLAHFAVAQRAGGCATLSTTLQAELAPRYTTQPTDLTTHLAGRVYRLQAVLPAVSSTQLRAQLCRDGVCDNAEWLPSTVQGAILSHNPYF